MFFKRRRQRQHWDGIAHKLYARMVQQARQPYFYTEMNVADTLEGRFDLLALHMSLLVRRLGTCDLSQALVDTMFADMDVNLREVGVSDISIGRKVRKLAESFNGRLHVYAAALDNNDHDAFQQALCRNVYGHMDEPCAPPLALYAFGLAAQLQAIPQDVLLAGELDMDQP